MKTIDIQLRYVTQARSGDKGNIADLSLFAKTEEIYQLILQQVTEEKVKKHFVGLVLGKVTRYPVPQLLAIKFVLEDALGGGAAASLRTDSLGKSFASNLLRLKIKIDERLLTEEHTIELPSQNV